MWNSARFVYGSFVGKENHLALFERQAETLGASLALTRVSSAKEIVSTSPKRTPPPIRADLVLLEQQPAPSDVPTEDGEEGAAEGEFYLDVLPSVQGIAFLGSTIPDTSEVSKRTEVYTYTVESGDTPSSIANLFGISLSTLFWENKLSTWSVIRPGDQLIILPANGISHKVAKGETAQSVAKKYSANVDDVIAFNNLSADGTLKEGETIIVPDGIPPAPPKPKTVKPIEVARENVLAPQGWLIQPAPGRNWGRRHGFNGVDIANSCGTPILAAAAGTVIVADAVGWNGGYGRYVKIQHPNGVVTLYAHARELFVESGVSVNQGDAIALMGSSGNSTGCHVHFEVRGAKNPFVRR